METVLRLPPGKRRLIVRHVRRDPQFTPQLYFWTLDEEYLLSFEQAIWDSTSNQVSSFVFAELCDYEFLSMCAIDEKEEMLYILFDLRKMWHLQHVRLTYEKPDKLGYRRISDWKKVLLCVIDPRMINASEKSAMRFDVSVAAINVCPSTAEPILHCKMLLGNPGELPQMCFFPRGDGTRRVEIDLQVLSPHATNHLEARSHVFSRSNDMLTLISYHTRNLQQLDDGWSDPGFMLLYSHDDQMQRINTLAIHPVQLVHNFLPKTLLNGLKTSEFGGQISDSMFIGSHLQLLGHVHKYVLFFFHHNYVLAAKWPKDWYKLKPVPEVQQSKIMCVNKQKKHGQRQGQIRDVWLSSTDLFFKVEKSGAEAIRRMRLRHEFKDYRKCAFCGKEEKRKKRNKMGKRLSSFKVCRLCKELNLHKCNRDTSPGCHYCSLECQRKHWKEHKVVHSRAWKQGK